MKKILFIPFLLLGINGCTSESDGTSSYQIRYNSPTVKITNSKDADGNSVPLVVNEGEDLTINYNIVDPDSGTFFISVMLVESGSDEIIHDETLGNIVVLESENKIIFTPSSIQEDKNIKLYLRVLDPQNLESLDIVDISIVEAVNSNPISSVLILNNNIIEGSSLEYSVTYSDPDINDDLVVSQEIYLEDPNICILDCTTLDSTFTNEDNNFVVELNTTFNVPKTELWLKVDVSDQQGVTSVIQSFFVNKTIEDSSPMVNFVSLNNYTIFENVEIIESEQSVLTINFDTVMGDLDYYNIEIVPNVLESGFLENNITLNPESDESGNVINNTGIITYDLERFNVEGNTDVNINFSFYNEYGYQDTITMPITIIENVVRELENLPDDYNQMVYLYASYKVIQEEERVQGVFLDYLVSKRIITIIEKEQHISDLDTIKTNENIAIESLISQIGNILNSETPNMSNAYDLYVQLDSLIANYGKSSVNNINNISILDTFNKLPLLVETAISNNNLGNSRFVGNPTYGFWLDDNLSTWVFNEKYSILELLNETINQHCEG
jgi:hypothetical protein